MSKSKKLVLLKHLEEISGVHRRPTVAYVANFPPRDDSSHSATAPAELTVLDFKRYYVIKQDPGKESLGLGECIYEREYGGIIYAYSSISYNEWADTAAASHARLWHVERECTLDSTEDIDLATQVINRPTSIMVQDSTIFVANMVPNKYEIPAHYQGVVTRGAVTTDTPNLPAFSTRKLPANSPWTPRKFMSSSASESEAMRTAADAGYGTWVRCPSTVPYLYFAALGHTKGQYNNMIHLYSCKKDKANRGTDVLWSDWKIKFEYGHITGPFTTHVTYDSVKNQYRMFFFFGGQVSIDRAYQFGFASILLDSTGFIAKPGNGTIIASDTQIVQLPSAPVSQAPHLVEWDGNLLVIIQSEDELFVRMTKIGKDGDITDKEADWKTINTKFKAIPQSQLSDSFKVPKQDTPDNIGGAVVVPPEFISD